MLEALRLKGHKGIKEVNLVDLRHINVLSGKNNSGKSSILEAVRDKTKCFVGMLLRKEDFENLARIYRPLVHTSSPSANEILETLRDFIRKHNGNFLYINSLDDYIAEFRQLFKKRYGSNYGASAFAFNEFLTTLYSSIESNFKPCLINPKRKIEARSQINTAVKLSTNGDNLLNELFFLKNQAPYSKENNNYIAIFNSFKQITGGAEFNVLPDKENSVRLQFRVDKCDSWLDADDCGLGFREILLIITFVFSSDFNFIQVEEPENHLHPEYQRKLLNFISGAKDKQFLISTHSNIFLDTSYVDKVLLVYFNGQVCVEEKTDKARILNELGYSASDNLISDLIILTEGPKDFPAIEEFLKKMKGLGDYAIKFLPLGGDIMSQIDLSVLKENNKLIALIDADPGSKTIREAFKRNCNSLSIECFQLERYALENYFSLRAIRDVFGSQVRREITAIKPDEKLETQIGLNVKNRSRKIANLMTLNEIEDTDLFEFLTRVERILKSS